MDPVEAVVPPVEPLPVVPVEPPVVLPPDVVPPEGAVESDPVEPEGLVEPESPVEEVVPPVEAALELLELELPDPVELVSVVLLLLVDGAVWLELDWAGAVSSERATVPRSGLMVRAAASRKESAERSRLRDLAGREPTAWCRARRSRLASLPEGDFAVLRVTANRPSSRGFILMLRSLPWSPRSQ